jgi:hypothetical protein
MSCKVGAKLFIKKEGKKMERKRESSSPLVYIVVFVVFVCSLGSYSTWSSVARVSLSVEKGTRKDKGYCCSYVIKTTCMRRKMAHVYKGHLSIYLSIKVLLISNT